VGLGNATLWQKMAEVTVDACETVDLLCAAVVLEGAVVGDEGLLVAPINRHLRALSEVDRGRRLALTAGVS